MRRPMLTVLALAAIVAGLPAPPANADTVFFSLGNRLRCPLTPDPSRPCDPGHTEPAIRVDPTTGNAWVSNQNGIIIGGRGGGHLFRRQYGQSWRFVDKFDQIPGVSNRAPWSHGGGDTDLTIGTTGTVFAVSLWAGANTLGAYDQSGTRLYQNFVAGKPLVDRQWIASHGPNTLYMTYWDFTGPRSIWVSKSTDGGQTWALATRSSVGNNNSNFTGIGNIVVNQSNGHVFSLFSRDPAGASNQQLILARSTNGGQSFENRLVFQDTATNPPGEEISTLFPSIAVDRAGNLFAVWSDESNVWLSSSTDEGETWTAPVQVNDPVASRTSVFPWVAAGSSGRVAIAWIGGTAVSPANPNPHQPFYAYYAMTINGTSATPTFDRGRASDDPVHQAGICLQGLGCDGFSFPELGEPLEEPAEELFDQTAEPFLEVSERTRENLLGENESDSGNRRIAEVVTVAIDVDGFALVAYPDDFEGGSEVTTLTVVAKQSTGNRLYAPGDCPHPTIPCS